MARRAAAESAVAPPATEAAPAADYGAQPPVARGAGALRRSGRRPPAGQGGCSRNRRRPKAPPAAATGPPDPGRRPPTAPVPAVHRVAAAGDSGLGLAASATIWATGRSSCRPRSCSTVARHLRDAPDALFDYCSDVTATDWPPRAERFDVVVHALFDSAPASRARQGQGRGAAARAVGHRHLAGGELARARGVRHVRRSTSPGIRIAAAF